MNRVLSISSTFDLINIVYKVSSICFYIFVEIRKSMRGYVRKFFEDNVTKNIIKLLLTGNQLDRTKYIQHILLIMTIFGSI